MACPAETTSIYATGNFIDGDTLRSYSEVAYDGGQNEPAIGDELGSGAEVGWILISYTLTGGGWAGNNAAGVLTIEKDGDTTCGWADNAQIDNVTQANVLANGGAALGVDGIPLNFVSSEHDVYVRSWLYNERPSKAFRFTSDGSAVTEWIHVDMGSDVSIDFAAVINHNLDCSEVTMFRLKARRDADGPFSDCDDRGYEDPQNDFAEWDFTCCEATDACGTVTDVTNSCMKLDFSDLDTDQFRYWLLCVAHSGADIEIGEFILTNWCRFDNFYIRSDSEGPVIYTGSQQTHYGQDWDNYYSDAMRFVLQPLQETPVSGAIDELRLFLQAIQGAAGRFVFVPDDNYCETKCQCYYVKVEGQEFLANRVSVGYPQLLDWNIPLKELTKGISLL